jgi:hypothetical protein
MAPAFGFTLNMYREPFFAVIQNQTEELSEP